MKPLSTFSKIIFLGVVIVACAGGIAAPHVWTWYAFNRTHMTIRATVTGFDTTPFDASSGAPSRMKVLLEDQRTLYVTLPARPVNVGDKIKLWLDVDNGTVTLKN